jgi:predicted ester cyclase
MKENYPTNLMLMLKLHDSLFRNLNVDAAMECLADTFVWSQAALPSLPAPGREGLQQFASQLHAAFPDLQWQTEEPLGQGDRVVARWSMRGTHDGELWGQQATHHPIYVTGIHIARVENNRIAELWQNWGLMGLLQQLGFLPILGEQTVYPIWNYPEPGSIRTPNV